MFFPWQDNPEYQMECTDEEYERMIKNISDNRVRKYLFGETKQGKKTQGIISLFNLTKEQVKWWIWVYENDNVSDFDMMLQENPSTPNDAFISTGSPIFDNDKIKLRLEYLRQRYEINPPKVGRFSYEWNNPETKDSIKDSSIKWVDDNYGFVTIYEMPKLNCL